MVSQFGLEHHLELEDTQEYSFDFPNQVILHIGADGCGILGDAGGDSGTVRTEYSATTQGTTKLQATINYLLPPLPTFLTEEFAKKFAKQWTNYQTK